jgi:hypothetical protein
MGASMDRETLLRKFYSDELTAMRAEIAGLQRSPAKYLDAVLTAEPTSGIELYERYHNLRDQFRRDFPESASRLPATRYRTSEDGSLQWPDLASLDRDIEVILAIISSIMGNPPTTR